MSGNLTKAQRAYMLAYADAAIKRDAEQPRYIYLGNGIWWRVKRHD